MLIVKYGRPPGMNRVGVVVGNYVDPDMGEMTLIRTAYNVVAGQKYDSIPAAKVEPATYEELIANIHYEREEVDKRMLRFVNELEQTITATPVAG